MSRTPEPHRAAHTPLPAPGLQLIDVDVESISGAAPDPGGESDPLGRYRYPRRWPAQLAGER